MLFVPEPNSWLTKVRTNGSAKRNGGGWNGLLWVGGVKCCVRSDSGCGKVETRMAEGGSVIAVSIHVVIFSFG